MKTSDLVIHLVKAANPQVMTFEVRKKKLILGEMEAYFFLSDLGKKTDYSNNKKESFALAEKISKIEGVENLFVSKFSVQIENSKSSFWTKKNCDLLSELIREYLKSKYRV